LSYRGKSKGSYGTQIRRARKVQARRSDHAKAIDERLKAPKAKSVEQWLSAPNRFYLPTVDTNKPEKKEQKNEPLNSSVIDKDVLDDKTPKNIAIYAKALKILKTAKIPFELGMNGGVYVAPSNRQRADELLEKCTNAWYKYYHSAKYEAS
jgi:hypothetical protein